MSAVIIDEALLIGMGATAADAARYARELAAQCHRHEIRTPVRVAHFLGQVFHESGKLRTVVENLNYSAEGLQRTWPKRFDAGTAQRYARQPERIANLVYADRMGNGPESSGDGWKFRGRGLIQITGRENYQRFLAWAGVPREANPQFVADMPSLAVGSAVWFWLSKSLNVIADTGSVEAVTKRVNGGFNGLDDRRRLTQAALSLIEA